MVVWKLLDTTNKEMAHYIGEDLEIQIVGDRLHARKAKHMYGMRTSSIQGIYPYDDNLMVKTENSKYFFKPINVDLAEE